MNIKSLRSDKIYRRVAQAPQEEKVELFRQEMLAPFMKKWEIQHIPFKAEEPNGFDVITLNNIMNISPNQITNEISTEIELISSDSFWSECEDAVKKSLHLFAEHGVNLSVSDYLFTILLGNPESPSLMLSEGYSGDGGIPGYIFCTLVPNEYTIPRMKAALAHECNHNVRYQFIQWDHTVTLGELIVSEGLAENFATSIFGEDMLGPWVSKTTAQMLNERIKPVLKEQLQIAGFDKIAPYLYGDEIAKLQNYEPVNMPYSAGYACGYYLIKYYLEKTGKSIFEATITPANQILDDIEGFWDEETIISG
ncbi:Zn-dependent protease [Paenibacillaceae bacterium]|nr:Zn-dependent protease [Paenibacillaceae bacterium]